jgi:hypothetical protein
VKAYEQAQDSEQRGHLRQARDSLEECMADAEPTCPILARKCWTTHNELELAIPSVVPIVTDDAGTALVEVRVSMDGEVLASRLDGRALPVDPGMHEFSFATGGHVFAAQRVLIAEGQQYRSLTVVKHAAEIGLASPDSPRSGDAHGHGVSAWPYVIGVTGLGALGAAALLTYWGRQDNELLARCAPDCDPASLSHIRELYTAADISVAAGAGALVLSTVLFATHHSSREKTSYAVDIRPTRSGASATIAGAF